VGIRYEENTRFRVERICCKAEIAFARRLPLSELTSRGIIVEHGAYKMKHASTIWSDQGLMEAHLTAARDLGCPEWLIPLFRRWMERRQQRKG